MNRIQSDQNQTRCPVMTSQEGPTLGEWCLKMMVTVSEKTFLDLQIWHGTITCMGCWSPTSHRKSHFSPVQAPASPGAKMQACSCPGKGLVSASVHGAEKDCGGGREALWGDGQISRSTSGDTCQVAIPRPAQMKVPTLCLGMFFPSPGSPRFFFFFFFKHYFARE